METGFYLCGVTSRGNEDEENLFNELYDKFSHNELSVHELIQNIADFQGFDLNSANENKEDYSEDIYTKCFTDGDFILSYDNLEGSYDVYLIDMGKKHYDELMKYEITFVHSDYLDDFLTICHENDIYPKCYSEHNNFYGYFL